MLLIEFGYKQQWQPLKVAIVYFYAPLNMSKQKVH